MRLKIIRTTDTASATANAISQLKKLEENVLKGVEYVFDPGAPGPIVESREEYANAIPEVLKRVRQTNEEGGFDAIIIQGFADPALLPAREISKIPVCGLGHSAMHVASLISNRFSIIQPLQVQAILARQNAILYGFDRKLASIRTIETKLKDLMPGTGREHYVGLIVAQSRKAILEDGADTIIVGGTAQGPMADEVRDRLWAEGLQAQVVYPYRAAIAMAKALVEMGLRHSDLAFPPAVPFDRPTPVH